MANRSFRKWKIAGVIVIGVAIAGVFGWFSYHRSETTDEIASGNGRLEATEIDIATKFQGRVAEILFHEGDFIEAGQVASRMDTKSLAAQLSSGRQRQKSNRHGMNRLTRQQLSRDEKASWILPKKIIDVRAVFFDLIKGPSP